MDAKTLTLLEYDQVLQLLAAQAVTVWGKELALNLHPRTEREVVEAALAETEEGVKLLEQGGLPWGGLVDLRPVLQRARLGGLLTPEELLAVASTTEALERLRGALAHRGEGFPLLSAQARAIKVDPRLGREIRRCLTEGGEVDDRASPELARLRARLRTVQNRVRDRLEELVRSAEMRRYLQEPVVTVRNGRLVLPVRQEYRGQVPGVVHDASASGATLFVEPLAVVELNNQARALAAEEQEEVEKILQALSDLVRAQADALSESLERAARLDLALAKARLAAAQGAVRPRLNTCGRVNLRSARHPLLRGEVVPIDLRLGEEFDLLVLTGPNTGGKTVTLKTVGLLHLMAQSGLFIPATPESEVSLFDEILADIGDEQSIAQNLSTFSSHLSNIVRLFGLIRGQSLVLLDELGTGTDPAEGAALAIAILEELRGRAKAVVTTHFSELKTYAYNAPRVENAAVEFDAISLRPTYRLLIGLPGRSNALEIAARLGLRPEIIERARRLLPGARVELEELLRHLEKERRSAEEARREVERQREEARRWAEEYRGQSTRLREERSRIVAEARVQAERLLKEARTEIDALVGELRQLVARPPARREEVEAAAAAVRRGLADLEERLAHWWAEEEAEGGGLGAGRSPEGSAGPAAETVAPLEPGARVWVATLNQEGTVIAPAAGGAAVEVQLGSLRATVPLNSVRSLPQEHRLPTEKARRSNVEQLARAKAAAISPELHVRRLPVAEALERTSKYLDDALLAGLTKVRIVHGKGTGALRKAVRAYLEQHPRVVRFQSASYAEGGDGVTVVELE